jgi:hypothetical protein
MTTEENIVTATVAEPVIDYAEAKIDAEMAEREAKAAADHAAFMEELNARRAEEAVIAAEQDAALAAVKAACEAERAALKEAT